MPPDAGPSGASSWPLERLHTVLARGKLILGGRHRLTQSGKGALQDEAEGAAIISEVAFDEGQVHRIGNRASFRPARPSHTTRKTQDVVPK